MASIATSIQIIDRFSAPINNMIVALDNMCSAYESVQDSMNTGFNTRTIDQARQAIDAAAQQVTQLGINIEDNEEHQQNFNRTVQNGSSAMDGLLGKVTSLVAAYATFQTVEKVMDMSDELSQTIARLNLMNDGAQTTKELFDKIYVSAQSTHSPLIETANAIAKMGNNAGAAFSSNDELIAFMEQVNKQFVIGGASATEQSNAIMQLSQAMASGALRGDELNSILEAAPGIARTIEESMGWAEGSIKSYAEEGKVTAEVVKSSLLNMADDINAKFEQMPMTWGQVWTTMGNAALMQMQPVLTKVNEIANNEDFQLFAANAVSAFSMVAVALLNILEYAGAVASFISENWSIIEPIVMGIVTALGLYAAALLIGKGIMLAVAAAQAIHTAMTSAWSVATFMATVRQQGLNAALAACPITWIIAAIIALIAIIYAVCAAIAKMTGVANSGFGVICGGVNVVIQFFKNLGLTVANIALGIGNAIAALGSNMMTAFHNAICSVQSWFYNLLSTALTVVEGICKALNKLPFVEFDYSGISSAADDYAAKASEAAGNKEDYKSIGDAFNDGMSTFDTFQDGWASDAFNAGAAWGDGVADKVSNMFSGSDGGVDASNMFNGGGYSGYDAGQVPANIADTAANTGKAADSLDITSEDLKYLRDIAEQDAINRFTTAEIKVDMGGITNNVSGDADLDGIVDYLANGVNEAMEKAAEGVHD